jgi:SAP domain
MKKLELIPSRSKTWQVLFLAVLLPLSFWAFLPVVDSFAPSPLLPKPSRLIRKNFYTFASRRTNIREEADDDDENFVDEPVTLPHGMEEALTEQDLEGLTVPQLQQQLRLRGLKVSGRKRELMDRLLGGGGSSSSSSSAAETIRKAQELAPEQGKEFVDVTEYLDEEDRGKQVKTWTNKKDNNVIDAEFETDSGKEESKNDNKAEVWGSEARIVDDYEGRRLVVDCLSQLVVEFKGSNQSYVSALVVASRDALKPFLAGGEVNAKNQTQAEQRLREIQTKREKEHQIPRRMNDDIGSDEGDEERLYANVMSRYDSCAKGWTINYLFFPCIF